MTFFRVIKRALQSPLRPLLFYALVFCKAFFRRFWIEIVHLPYPIFSSTISPERIAVLQHSARKNFFFSLEDRLRIVKNLQKDFPPTSNRLLQEAQRICRHEFQFLGSGQWQRRDTIPWNTDWKNNKIWPKIFAAHFSPLSFPGKGELKMPWELSRFYHAVTLGQAYWISGDERYPREFVTQVLDWEKENPLYQSCNWVNAMEASIRLANLLCGWCFFLDSPSLALNFHEKFIQLCWRHGHFIMHNLERGFVRTNHYFADLLGVIYLGVLFPAMPRTQRWLATCLREFEKEVAHQFYDDGANFEASIPYHRLSAEIALLVLLLCRKNSIPLRAETIARLEKSCLFTLFYTKPNGLAPQIGDNDDGRIHRFDSIFEEEMRDHRHLLSLARYVFPDRKEFQSYESYSIAPLWLCSFIDVASRENVPFAPLSHFFPNAGIYIMRSEDNFCIIDTGNNGQDGVGGHGHNDTLSFELCIQGEDVIVDPGTYIYTEDASIRNLFRSTAMHNIVQIDAEEINPLSETELFSLPDRSYPRVISWNSTIERDELITEHEGYKRLSNGVVHQRRFFWQKKERILTIDDILRGSGTHRFDWFFHCAPGITVQQNGNVIYLATLKGRRYSLSTEEGGVFALSEGFVSPAYGVRIPAPVIAYRCVASAGERIYRFIIQPVVS